MVFNDTSLKQGIVQEIWFNLFGDSGDHSSDFSLADITRSVNKWYDTVTTKILQADTRWLWDDANKTDLPISDITLVANQKDYGVASATYLKILRVDCLDQNGSPMNLIPFDLGDIRGTADNSFLGTSGSPKYYRKQGSSIFLYPTPSYGSTNGLRVFYQRSPDYFVAGDTTKTPGFATMFHQILSLGAAMDYAIIAGMGDKVKIFDALLWGDARKQKQGLFDDLQEFYASRDKEKTRLRTHKTDYGEIALQTQPGRYNTGSKFNIP